MKHETRNTMFQDKGFSFIELIIVTTILVMLSILTSASIYHLRATNRDAKRVADILEIQMALEEYYRSENQYPNFIIPGAPLEKDGFVYLSTVPRNPLPANDGDCPVNSEYEYDMLEGGRSYILGFCISGRSGDVGPGQNTATPEGIITCLPNCVASCGEGDNGCGGTCTNLVVCQVGFTCHYDHCIQDLP